MNPIEKLAREICWAGFLLPKKIGTTKAAYWRELPEETRAFYRSEANRIIWLTRRIDPQVLAKALENAPPRHSPAESKGVSE